MRTLRDLAERLFLKTLQRERFVRNVQRLDSLPSPPSHKPERRHMEAGEDNRSLSYVWIRGSRETMETLLRRPILVRSTDILEYDHEGLSIRMALFHYWRVPWEAVDGALTRFFHSDLPGLKVFVFHAQRPVDLWFIEEAMARWERFLQEAPPGSLLKSYCVHHHLMEREVTP